MAQYTISSETLTDIADAIRKKTKSTDAIQTKDMAEVIENFQGEGGIDTSDATATASDVLSDKTAYVNGKKITGTIETKSADDVTVSGPDVIIPAGYYDSDVAKSVKSAPQAIPSISVSSSGLVTASVTQSEGYVVGGTETATQQLPTQSAKTIKPNTSSQVAVAKGVYTIGEVTVEGDSNLVAENIAEGVSIFGVTGTHSGDSGIDTSDATAISSDILQGKTAYVDGEKITGTIESKTASNLSASGATVTVPAGYYANDASKSVSSGSATTPATTITKNPTISVNSSGLITASVSGTQNVTPTVSAGYVSSGTAGTITVSGSNTKQLTTQSAKAITPSTSTQTAVASGVYTTGEVTVNPIPSDYIIPSGTKTITTNGTHDVKSYASATVNVSGEDVTDETSAYTTKLVELDTVITALETELAGKASGGNSGGASIETCTVTLTAISGFLVYGYTVYDGTKIDTMFYYNTSEPATSPLVLNNVICNSFIICKHRGTMTEPAYTINGTAKMLLLDSTGSQYSFIQAPSVSGESCTINLYDND